MVKLFKEEKSQMENLRIIII